MAMTLLARLLLLVLSAPAMVGCSTARQTSDGLDSETLSSEIIVYEVERTEPLITAADDPYAVTGDRP